ncbi:hypothetical protein HYW75_01010 [Candidatus Pacearchaeota archaeon]|nr:hypothetical protein [Candidatus Pacearchaeota archaeon]
MKIKRGNKSSNLYLILLITLFLLILVLGYFLIINSNLGNKLTSTGKVIISKENKGKSALQKVIGILSSSSTCGNGICESDETHLSCKIDCLPEIPTNKNVLCVFNKNSQISKDICEYYLQKRPGANALGLDIPDSILKEYGPEAFDETADSVDFIKYINKPILTYVNNHPELKITHLAITKGIPIRARETSLGRDSQGAWVSISGAVLLAFETNFDKYPTLKEILELAEKESTYLDNGGYKNNLYHFNPQDFENNQRLLKPRFAVSYLTGYKLDDIKAMINKAMAPPPDLSTSKWLLDRDEDSFTIREDNLEDIRSYITSTGISDNNIYLERTNSRFDVTPLPFNVPIVGYVGPDSYHSYYGGLWISGNPAIKTDVSNRALLVGVASYTASTFTGDPIHSTGMPHYDQGKIADAITSKTFGGTDYSRAFGGAVGSVDEPNLVGAMDLVAPLFRSYASGLTFAESFLSSFAKNRNIPMGDPLMRITDSIDNKLPNSAQCNFDIQCKSGNCNLDNLGIKKCHEISIKCILSINNLLIKEKINGDKICENDKSKIQTCNNGIWQESLCPAKNTCSSPISGGNAFCGTNIGSTCSQDSNCASGNCDTDIFGVKRCHATSNNCVYDQYGYETSSGWFACIDTIKRKQCSNSVWQNEQTCKNGCSLGACIEEDLFVPPNKFKFTANGATYGLTFPINTGQKKISEIFTNIPSGSGLVINTWKSGGGYNLNGCDDLGCDEPNYIFKSGEGFQLYINGLLSPYELTLPGSQFTSPVSLKLLSGYNLVGVPYCGEKYTASRLLDEINKDGKKCSIIYNNKEVTSGPKYYFGENSGSTDMEYKDFKLQNYESYFIKCDQGVDYLWTPTCQPVISISVIDASADEKGKDPGSFTITRSGSLSSEITIGLSIKGSAVNSFDYDSIENFITIPAGVSSVIVKIIPISDSVSEETEDVILELQDGATYELGSQTSAKAEIKNNEVPETSITFPTDGSVFKAPTTFTISATASDSDGNIKKVEFYNGAIKLGEDTSSHYSFTISNAGIGKYQLITKAYDNWDAINNSLPINIIVTDAPIVSITSHKDGDVINSALPTNINLLAIATDSDSQIQKVEFYNGATLIGTDSDGSNGWEVLWLNVAAGTYSVFAKAYDAYGINAISSIIKVIVNSQPSVSISSPITGAILTAPASFTLKAKASDTDGSITKVEFYNGATLIGTDSVGLNGEFDIGVTNLDSGTYSFTAKAFDNNNGLSISITVKKPNVAPTVSISSPATGATFTDPATVSITATASDSDGSIKRVEFYNGATKISEDTSAPFTASLTALTAGTYSLTAKAVDNEDASTTSTAVSITVKKPNVAPTVSISSPATGATFTKTDTIPIIVTGTDSDGSINKIEIFIGNSKLGEALLKAGTNNQYIYNWPNVAAGTYSLTAKATDNDGVSTTSGSINLVVNNPPTISITSPTNGASFDAPASVSINVDVSDSDGQITKVEFYNGAIKLGEDSNSPYEFSWENVLEGTYLITTKALDNKAANTISENVAIIVKKPEQQLLSCSGDEPSASDGIIKGIKQYLSGTTQITSWTYSPIADLITPCLWRCKPENNYIKDENSCKFKEVFSINDLKSNQINKDIFVNNILNNKTLFVVNNVTINQIDLKNISLITNNLTESKAYLIVSNLTIPENKTKTLYIKKLDANSNGVCIADIYSVSNKDQILSNCQKILCPGTLEGIYNCSIEGENYIVSGLKHSGVIEDVINTQQPPGGSPGGGGGGGGGGGTGEQTFVVSFDQLKQGSTKELAINDKIKFDAFGNHVNYLTTLLEVKENSAVVRFSKSDGTEILRTEIFLSEQKKINLNKDNYNDIIIRIENVSISNNKTNLKILYLKEEIIIPREEEHERGVQNESEIENPPISGITKEKGNKISVIFIWAGVIIALLGVALAIYKIIVLKKKQGFSSSELKRVKEISERSALR